MKKRIISVLSLIFILPLLVGCGEKKPIFEEITYSSAEEEKAYSDYYEKEATDISEVTKDNYSSILKDRFGIDLSELEKKGYKLKEVLGETFYESEYVTLTYDDKPGEPNAQDKTFLKAVYDATKRIGDGTLYKSNEAEIITEEKEDDFEKVWYYQAWFYIWEGRTHKVYCYESSENNVITYEVTLTIEKKNTLGNSKNIVSVSKDNYAKLVKENFGISPVYNDDWEFNVVTTSGAFTGNYISFNVSGKVDEDDVEEYYDEEEESYVHDPSRAHSEEEWDKLAVKLAQDYYKKLSKLSKKGIFETKVDSKTYKSSQGKKIKSAKDVKFNKDGKCDWLYYYKDKKVRIILDHYADSAISIGFSK